ncbi:glycosyltransferase family 2 protein [Frigoribacterium sp. PvP032]|uniref:glycosyltransferase family 2 protein n=1 Tax=Frigoribacterium sp. PvP032 TaxID=2806589 RepID=UPI001AEAFABA|nr:glycosyltransferase [Frigoribacterium sp. PvP032]MBP1190264.1 GT2 family glycosyltransferase [Frigoribacterium sp. PvP032]
MTAPRVSVVVLAWKLVDELVLCLDALAAQVDAPEFEVVVVENGARPEIGRALDDVPGLVRVRLAANAGFGAGCDAGAAAASGSALVFLNDDALPRPAWLAALATRADQADSPVAVGSLLVDQHEVVQEAGSRLRRDAGTVQLGAGATLGDARRDGLLVSRPVDYCSAAALWVDRAAFDAADGFDDLFTPAYYEDVDLQLRLRLAGGLVVVEPAAVVQHESGTSTGSVPDYRAFLGRRNGSLFAERWASTLAAAPEPDAPLGQLTEVRPPAPVVLPDDEAEAPHPAVAASYVAWLLERARRAEEAEETLAHRFADLQHTHHESLQLTHAMKLRIDELESTTLTDQVRSRVSARFRRG